MFVKLAGQEYSFQSRGLIQFLHLLQSAHPCSINWSEIQSHFGAIDPKQIARFIDMLERRQLDWVEYQTKTKGPFKLKLYALPIELPAVDEIEGNEPRSAIDSMIDKKSPLHIPIELSVNPAWLIWMDSLLQAQVTMRKDFKDKITIQKYFEDATKASSELPEWTLTVVLLNQAHAAERNSDYRLASQYLRRFDSIQRDGYAHPAGKLRASIIRAKIYYDKGQFSLSEKVLNRCNALPASATSGWLNISALLAGQAYLRNQNVVKEVEKGLTDLLIAMGAVFLDQGDLSKLDVLSFNFANNLYRALQNKKIAATSSDLVLSWFLASRQICNLLRVGDDSILHELLIYDVLQEFGQPNSKQLKEQVPKPVEYPSFLKKCIELAWSKQHRLEVAQCLVRQLHLEKSKVVKAQIYEQVKALFIELKRNDLLVKLDMSLGSIG